MKLDEIKPGGYYTNENGIYVIASGSIQFGNFQATTIDLGQVKMYPLSEFQLTSFQEAFHNEINQIVNTYKEQIKTLIDENEQLEKKLNTINWSNEYYDNKHKEEIDQLKEKFNEQQKDFDRRFLELHDVFQAKREEIVTLSNQLNEALNFITHLQNYISAKHLESENLIFKSNTGGK